MTYYTIVSNIRDNVVTENFYIESEIEMAMEELSKQTTKHLGGDCFPMDDGTIGFCMSNGDCVYLEERNNMQVGLF